MTGRREIDAFVEALDGVPPRTEFTACAGWRGSRIGRPPHFGRRGDRQSGRGAPRPSTGIPVFGPFAEREVEFWGIDDGELRRRLTDGERRMSCGLDAVLASSGDRAVPGMGWGMPIADVILHLRQEFAIHRWDLVGDDDESDEILTGDWTERPEQSAACRRRSPRASPRRRTTSPRRRRAPSRSGWVPPTSTTSNSPATRPAAARAVVTCCGVQSPSPTRATPSRPWRSDQRRPARRSHRPAIQIGHRGRWTPATVVQRSSAWGTGSPASAGRSMAMPVSSTRRHGRAGSRSTVPRRPSTRRSHRGRAPVRGSAGRPRACRVSSPAGRRPVNAARQRRHQRSEAHADRSPWPRRRA